MFNSRKYGDPLPAEAEPAGTYHAWRDPETKRWHRAKLAEVSIVGFYQGSAGLQVVTEDAGYLALRTWQPATKDWSPATPLCTAAEQPSVPGFMDVIGRTSGSHPETGLAIVTDGMVAGKDGQPAQHAMWSLLPAGK